MKISSILENKKLPGKANGIEIMSLDQFLSQKDDVEELDENNIFGNFYNKLKNVVLSILGKRSANPNDNAAFQRMMADITAPLDSSQYFRLWNEYKNDKNFYLPVPKYNDNQHYIYLWSNSIAQFLTNKFPRGDAETLSAAAEALASFGAKEAIKNRNIDEDEIKNNKIFTPLSYKDFVRQIDYLHDKMQQASHSRDDEKYNYWKQKYIDLENKARQGLVSESIPSFTPGSEMHKLHQKTMGEYGKELNILGKQLRIAQKHGDNDKVSELHSQIKKLQQQYGLDEATKLPADQREFGGQEFQDYMQRIVGTPDVDKKTGKVKVDKKGKEKYVSGKTKQDKYKMPYVHRSSVVKFYSEDGKRFREEDVLSALKQRPKKLLKQNEKMKHSNGELEQFFNVGFAALTGIAVDESTNKLIIVNTCPGAGSCKVDCFAMKGGKVQFEAAWLSDGRILTYLLNDPDGFFNTLSSEISKEEKLGDKGGYEVTVRWHDAGDFFSPEYLDLALKMAEKHPGVKFYAYTKMSNAALAEKPGNFIINWSEGAHTSQEKEVKKQDTKLTKTKNSRIVPMDAFDDLLVKDEKGNLVKGSEGQWQIQPDKLKELKQRLAKLYNLSSSSILSYDEYLTKPKIKNMRYNVIVAPGEGDISANDRDVISTLLLRH